nr:hypothetical protein [Tanacetum cinerariifolium]
QTATGKEISNPFMAGSLPKTTLSTFIHSNDVTRLQALVDKKKVVVTEAAIRDALHLDDAEGVNDVTRLQALVDKKKMVVTEAAIREVLRLDDAEGVDCCPTKRFLQSWHTWSMSAKRTSWNEFSSAMVSVVICLSTGRKFNFSKYIFDSLVRNVESTSKFYMYPRFIQLLIRKQVGNLSTHTTKYTSPALTQKEFANMRRVRKGFSGVETPLFKGMIVEQVIEEGGDAEEHVQDVTDGDAAQGDDTATHEEVLTVSQEPSIPSPTPPTPPPQPPQDLPST